MEIKIEIIQEKTLKITIITIPPTQILTMEMATINLIMEAPTTTIISMEAKEDQEAVGITIMGIMIRTAVGMEIVATNTSRAAATEALTKMIKQVQAVVATLKVEEINHRIIMREDTIPKRVSIMAAHSKIAIHRASMEAASTNRVASIIANKVAEQIITRITRRARNNDT